MGRPLSSEPVALGDGNELPQAMVAEVRSTGRLSALEMGLIGGMGLLFAMMIGILAVGWRIIRHQRLG